MAETNQSGLLTVRLVTSDRVLVDTTAEAVELPSMSGYLEAPLRTRSAAGMSWVLVRCGCTVETRRNQTFFVAWGFVEVLPERVTILAENALHPEEINVEQARDRAGGRARSCGRRRATMARSMTRPTPLTRQAEEKIALSRRPSLSRNLIFKR